MLSPFAPDKGGLGPPAEGGWGTTPSCLARATPGLRTAHPSDSDGVMMCGALKGVKIVHAKLAHEVR